LQSLVDLKFYTGFTQNIKERINNHNLGKVSSTNMRRPLKIIYFEASLNKSDALKREKYLKTSYGKRYIKNRLNNYLTEAE
jgi:putative endonuclease